MQNIVQLIEVYSKEVLFETSVENMNQAYKKATEYEAMGLEIKINAPSLPETLLANLGAKALEIEKLKSEIEAEVESHN